MGRRDLSKGSLIDPSARVGDGDETAATEPSLVTRRDWLQTRVLLVAAMVVPGCAATPRASARPKRSPRRSDRGYDVVIVGGGPGGLAAALTLGRSRKRVLLCDSGPRRDAAAAHIHNFVTRDGTPPEEFRRIGREQLAAYPNVEVQDVRVESISGARGAFHVHLASEAVQSRRVLLCTGVIDEYGHVRIDAMRSETSIPGVYAAGDLATQGQGAIWAAAAGARAATMINVELTMELASSGAP